MTNILSRDTMAELTERNIQRRRIELLNEVLLGIVKEAQCGNNVLILLAPCNPGFGNVSIYFKKEDKDWLIQELEKMGYRVELKVWDDDIKWCKDIWICW